MRLSWTGRALADLDDAGRYLAGHDPGAAGAMGSRILEAAQYLIAHPALGRAGRVPGTRELVVSGTPFILTYRVSFDEVQVLRLLHHARRWPTR